VSIKKETISQKNTILLRDKLLDNPDTPIDLFKEIKTYRRGAEKKFNYFINYRLRVAHNYHKHGHNSILFRHSKLEDNLKETLQLVKYSICVYAIMRYWDKLDPNCYLKKFFNTRMSSKEYRTKHPFIYSTAMSRYFFFLMFFRYRKTKHKKIYETIVENGKKLIGIDNAKPRKDKRLSLYEIYKKDRAKDAPYNLYETFFYFLLLANKDSMKEYTEKTNRYEKIVEKFDRKASELARKECDSYKASFVKPKQIVSSDMFCIPIKKKIDIFIDAIRQAVKNGDRVDLKKVNKEYAAIFDALNKKDTDEDEDISEDIIGNFHVGYAYIESPYIQYACLMDKFEKLSATVITAKKLRNILDGKNKYLEFMECPDGANFILDGYIEEARKKYLGKNSFQFVKLCFKLLEAYYRRRTSAGMPLDSNDIYEEMFYKRLKGKDITVHDKIIEKMKKENYPIKQDDREVPRKEKLFMAFNGALLSAGVAHIKFKSIYKPQPCLTGDVDLILEELGSTKSKSATTLYGVDKLVNHFSNNIKVLPQHEQEELFDDIQYYNEQIKEAQTILNTL